MDIAERRAPLSDSCGPPPFTGPVDRRARARHLVRAMPTTSWLCEPSLEVVGWRCPGMPGGPPSAAECPPVHELFLSRRGAHVRRVAARGVRATRALVADTSVIACAPGGEAYRIVERTGGEERATVLLLGEALLREALTDVDPAAADVARPRLPAAMVPLDAAAALAHDALVRAAREGDAVRAHEAALALVRHATAHDRTPPRARPSARVREAAIAARLLMAARYAEPLTLGAIGTLVGGLSPWQLSRAYRATFGVGVHAHLRDLRLDAALERLREGARGLSPIALAVGFSSHSHFSSAFRARFGRTPSGLAMRGARTRGAGHRSIPPEAAP